MSAASVGSSDAGAQLVELGDRRLAACSDVEHTALVAEGGERRTGDVADIDVVACLHAVAEDPRLLAACQRAEEDRDDASLTVRVLSRAVDVPVAERDVSCPVQPVVGAQVLLGCELRRAIRRERLAGRVLGGRRGAFAVDGTPGGREDDLGAVLPCAFQDPHGSEHVHVGVLDRPFDRDAHVGLRREVEDGLRPHGVEHVVERLSDVADVELSTGCDVVLRAVYERIDDGDLGTLCDECVDDMRADEAGSSGDDGPHIRILRTAIGWSACS